MTVYELISLLARYPGDAKVEPCIEGARKNRKIVGVSMPIPRRRIREEAPVLPVLVMILNDEGADS